MKPSTQSSSNRRSKKEVLLKRKPQQVVSKSLIAEFNSVEDFSEDQNTFVSTETFELTPESVEKCQNIENTPISTEMLEVTPDSDQKAQIFQESPISVVDSTVTFDSSTFSTPLNVVVDDAVENDNQEIVNLSTDGKSPEAQIVVDFLREARLQISDAAVVDPRHKMIVDAVVKIVMEDYYGSAQGDHRYSELVSLKVRTGLLCLFTWMVLVVVVLFKRSVAESQFPDVPPT